MLGEVNATLITMVPKIQHPTKVSEYRPIACCNVVYKCISKIISSRIQGCLDKLISINQSAFVPGRLIQDNLLITQELLKGYNRKKGPQRCALKIDIAKAYDTGCKEIQLTQLCFAGDLLMLCNGDYKFVEVLKEGLMEFSKTSGLIPNMNKSTIFFRSVKDCERRKILEVVPFTVGKLPMKYLGVPLITKNIGISECNQLVERVKQKVNDWKNKALSYAGRLQLISSVMASMHISVFLIPKKTVNDIEKALKGFLWCQRDLKRGAARVAWKNKESLWVKWVNVIKLKGKSIWEIKSDENDSGTWKAILNLRSKIRDSVWKKIGDGQITNIWFDKWCKEGPLFDIIPFKSRYEARLAENASIADMIVNKDWIWPKEWKMQFTCLSNIKILDLEEELTDCVLWKDNNGVDGRFSIRKVWEKFTEDK
ncbi:RNA-directed DNA polymerase, eukaryota, reverse transcriptase zinc-binding domain protein [Tanacetum coccineum]